MPRKEDPVGRAAMPLVLLMFVAAPMHWGEALVFTTSSMPGLWGGKEKGRSARVVLAADHRPALREGMEATMVLKVLEGVRMVGE